MTKQDYFNRLVDLGRSYSSHTLWPYTKNATRDSLKNRCGWMEKAVSLKDDQPELASVLYRAAWSTGYLPPNVAQQLRLM